MNLLDFGAYAGIIGGGFYLFFLLFAFRDSFAGRISWALRLEMAFFMVFMGFLVWEPATKAFHSTFWERPGGYGWLLLLPQ